jgi:hypothetical protein
MKAATDAFRLWRDTYRRLTERPGGTRAGSRCTAYTQCLRSSGARCVASSRHGRAAGRARLVLRLRVAIGGAGCVVIAGCGSSQTPTQSSSAVGGAGGQTIEHSNTAPAPTASSGAAAGADWATYLPRMGTSCDFSYSISGPGYSVRTHDSFRTVSVKLAGNSGVAVAIFREQDETAGQVVSTSSATVRYTLADGRLQIPASGLGLSGAGHASSAYTVTGSLPPLATFAVGSGAPLEYRVSTASEGTAVLGVSYQRIPDIKVRLTPAGQMDLVGISITPVSF